MSPVAERNTTLTTDQHQFSDALARVVQALDELRLVAQSRGWRKIHGQLFAGHQVARRALEFIQTADWS